ncbi:MAG: Cof-type HAD-IIB family hydrolase [Bacillota bacterium]
MTLLERTTNQVTGSITGRGIRLLALDADGTALDPTGRVTPATRQAIQDARKRGVRVVLATGRLHSSAVRIASEAGLDEPVLSCNGAAAASLTRPPRVWWREPLEADDVRRLVPVLEDFHCSFELYVLDHMYTSRRSLSLRAFWGWTRPQVRRAWRLLPRIWKDLRLVRMRPLSEWPATPEELPEKVMVTHVNGRRLDELHRLLKDMFPDRLEAARTGERLLEITRAGVSKGTGLARLAAALGIPPEEVMTIGDQGNDVSMLRWAGLGVAMGHAPDYVRQAADAVTLSNDRDGVAAAIQRFILDG